MGPTRQRPLPGSIRPARAPSGATLAAALGALLAAAAPSAAQGEFDRRLDPEEARRDAGEPLDEGASGEPVPDQDVPEDDRDPLFIPEEGFDPDALPPAGAERDLDLEREEESFWDRIRLKLEGRVRTGLGHDTNVFRAERSRRSDGFFRGQAELEVLARLPDGSEVFLELSGETLDYFERTRANEQFAGGFLEVFKPLTEWLDVGVQNTTEYSKQNLLDDNGDLFPRGRFGSFDEEVRLYLILRPHADVAFEAGAGYRLKNYEENFGVPSLDYAELRFDASVSYKVSRSPRSRAKLKYRFRRRDYEEFPARGRDGTTSPSPPRLDLFRHQLTLTYYQELDLGPVEARVILGLGVTYNQDLHENDRSYREGSASLRTEWWLIPDLTRLDVSLRLVARDFLVRRPVDQGGRLRHRLLDVSVGVWQRIDDWPLAVYASGGATVWRSGDPGEDYERFIVEAGLEASW